jgi:hypothetical protein
MITKPYGRKKPEAGEIGDEVFDALEHNIDINDAHTHDGVTSPLITSQNISKGSQLLPSANWVYVSNGLYKQTVSMIGGKQVDDLAFIFRDDSNGSQLHLSYEKVSSTQIEVFINDNSVDVKLLYV